MPEPANVFLVEEVERLSGYQVQVVAATVRDIRATLQAYLPNESVFVIDDIIDDVNPDEFTVIDQPVQDITNIEQIRKLKVDKQVPVHGAIEPYAVMVKKIRSAPKG